MNTNLPKAVGLHSIWQMLPFDFHVVRYLGWHGNLSIAWCTDNKMTCRAGSHTFAEEYSHGNALSLNKCWWNVH